jgi:hypothetical protein
MHHPVIWQHASQSVEAMRSWNRLAQEEEPRLEGFLRDLLSKVRG